MDRLLSATYGRASIFEERDCDVPFPSVDDDEAIAVEGSNGKPAPRLLDCFIHLIKICDILGHVLKNIYYAKARHHVGTQHIEHVLGALDRQLKNWYNSMPDSLKFELPASSESSGGAYPDPPSPISQMHMIYYTTVILLHRPFIPGPSQATLPTALPSYNICMSAANSILDIVNIMLNENHLKYVLNFTVYYIFTAGIIFIKSASASDPAQAFDAKVKINKIMRALDEIELTWHHAARSCNILGELAGLRDIDLECDSSTGQRPVMTTTTTTTAANIRTPPMSVTALRSSSDNRDLGQDGQWAASRPPPGYAVSYPSNEYRMSWTSSSSVTGQRQQTSMEGYTSTTAPTVDPFAAPGIIPAGPAQQQFDPLGAAFWGVPPSLDMKEWNNYFGGQSIMNSEEQARLNSHSASTSPTTTAHQQPPPLIPSYEFSPLTTARQPFTTLPPHQGQAQQQQQQQQQQQPIPPLGQRQGRQDANNNKSLIHTDSNVDVLSGVSPVAPAPGGAMLLGFLGGQTDPGPAPESLRNAGYGNMIDDDTRSQTAPRRDMVDSSGLMYW